MSDDPKEKEAVDQKNPTEGQAQLSEDALNQVSGGDQNVPAESVSFNYGTIEWTYTQQKRG